MFQLLEPMMIAGPAMIWLFVFGPLVVYPFARWRNNRDGIVDPQLGLKVALHYFKLIAFQLLLGAVLLLLWTVIRAGDGKGEAYRAAFALLIPAGLVFAVHTILLDRTNDKSLVTVRRMVLGLNLLLTGLLGFAALVGAFQALFAKGSSGDTGRLFIAGVFVYVGAWIGCGFRFVALTGADLAAGSGPPQNIVPPAPPAAASGGGLPPLGGGSFPPLSR